MAYVFIATLGQRPEAITIALDVLTQREGYQYSEICIVYTEPRPAPVGIKDALETLRREIPAAYSEINTEWHELRRQDGHALHDITDATSGWDYLHGMVQLLLNYRKRGDWIHLLIAGGRKAMSVYATIAATLTFGNHDMAFTVLSPPEITNNRGEFHIEKQALSRIQLVSFPVKQLKSSAEALPDDAAEIIKSLKERDLRKDFLVRLTDKEREIAEILIDNPRATNPEIAAALYKSPKTIENQLGEIYKKMDAYLDYKLETSTQKRRELLIDLLFNRLD